MIRVNSVNSVFIAIVLCCSCMSYIECSFFWSFMFLRKSTFYNWALHGEQNTASLLLHRLNCSLFDYLNVLNF